jgi:hypothetical protein
MMDRFTALTLEGVAVRMGRATPGKAFFLDIEPPLAVYLFVATPY